MENVKNRRLRMYVDDFEKFWKMHPDRDVDLCAMPIAPMINFAKNMGKELFYVTFDTSTLPDKKLLDDVSEIKFYVIFL